MAVDPSNNICITGTYYGTLDTDPGLGVNNITSNNSDDIFMVKLSPLGVFDWGKTIGTPNYENVGGIACDNLGNVFIGVSFSDSIDMDPGAPINYLYSNGYTDIMVLKLASNGNFIWGKNLGGADNEMLNSIATDANNNVYSMGQFSNTADFDPNASTQNLTSSGDYDIYVSSLDPNGNFRMAKKIGGVMEDNGYDILVNNLNQLVGYGYFRDTADFDPSPMVVNMTSTSFNNGELYQFKWNQCNTTSSTLNAYDCNSYTLNGQTYTSTGTYTQVIPNLVGCDSIITLNLTIGSTNTTINQTQCNGQPFVFNGQTYTTAGTYNQYYTNAAGCDSNTIINLNFGSPSTYAYNDVACDVYFFGNQIITASGIYTNVFTNASGCDSIVTLNLMINNSVYGTATMINCGPVVWNGQGLTMSGVYTGYFVSSLGCDSVIDLYLTINPIDFSNATDTVCQQLVWNGQTYTTSGIYTGVFQNTYGCDSTVTLNLTVKPQPNINTTQVGNTITATAVAPSTYQWINCQGNTIINGATSQSYTATSNGSYAVIVTLNSCSDTSACRPVVGIGINEVSSNDFIKVYPNPVKDIIQLEISSAMEGEYNVSILNLSGQILFTQNNNKLQQLEIPVADWAKGLYLLTLSNSTGKYIYKFTKE